jgi:hypothetical protein
MNSRYEDAFGKRTPALPLKETGNIVCGNALRVAWESVCPHSDDPEVETYIVGNPPYLGSMMQTSEQKSDKVLVFENISKNYKDLDYVAAWFVRGGQYIKRSTSSVAAFVSTNSICQGEQVDMLWPLIFDLQCDIAFAHTSFKWTNNAAAAAAVTCIIVAIKHTSNRATKKIFSDGKVKSVKNISPYLIEGENVIVKKSTKPLNGLPRMDYGNKATDDGNLILSSAQRENLLNEHPSAASLLREYIGSQEFTRGEIRYCLWISGSNLDTAFQISEISERIARVKEFRRASKGTQANSNADTPHLFVFRPHRDANSIIIPRVGSERRPYLTPGFLDGNTTVISDSASAIYDAEKYLFALLCSRLHLVWVGTVCGRLKTDIRYSNTLGWNTFPVPELSDEDKEALTKTAEGILLARDTYFDKTIAELYDPDHMQKDFPELWEAHQRNDEVLETIYNGRPFKNDTERLEHLFARYSAMVGKK